MPHRSLNAALLAPLFGIVSGGALTSLGTTTDKTDRYAWGENVGWVDWRCDTGTPGKGATVGQFICSGFICGENIGWINLGGDGTHLVRTNTID